MLVELARTNATALVALRAAGAERISREPVIWRIAGGSSERVLHELRRTGLVRDAVPDLVVPALSATTNGAAPARGAWWLRALDAAGLVPPGPGKPVTVVDTGLDLHHPEFAGRPDTFALNPQKITSSDDFHGTAVSSLIGAQGKSVLGIYPRARLYEWDASHDGGLELSGIIKGIEAATRVGRGVINLSFGSEADVPMLEDVVMQAFRRGSLVVAATGDTRGIDFSPYPSSYPHVLTVAATNRRDHVSLFSTGSSTLDVAAPGEDIEVAVPRSHDPSGYMVASGTSYSAALVSGALAWIWTRRPSLDNTQLIELVRRTARHVGAAGFSTDTGYGILDIGAALRAPAPARDPDEPNDDVAFVRPGPYFAHGEPLSTSATRATAIIHARVDQNKDPNDVYRAWLPAHGRLTVTARASSGDVILRIWGSRTPTVTERGTTAERDLLATCGPARCRTLDAINHTAQPVIFYVDVAPGVSQTASYVLSITARPRS
jgi:subtilisin family serine protease